MARHIAEKKALHSHHKQQQQQKATGIFMTVNHKCSKFRLILIRIHIPWQGLSMNSSWSYYLPLRMGKHDRLVIFASERVISIKNHITSHILRIDCNRQLYYCMRSGHSIL